MKQVSVCGRAFCMYVCVCVTVHALTCQVVDREVPVEMLQVLPDSRNTEVRVCARACCFFLVCARVSGCVSESNECARLS